MLQLWNVVDWLSVERSEAARAKKRETEKRQMIEANLVYSSYRQDLAAGTTIMERLNAPVIKSAYKYFVKLFLQPNEKANTSKIAALKIAFQQNPQECVIEEEEDVDEEGNSDVDD